MPYSDEELLGIVEEIDQTAASVSDWEAAFIESLLERRPTKLTPRQRDVIDRMKDTYLV